MSRLVLLFTLFLAWTPLEANDSSGTSSRPWWEHVYYDHLRPSVLNGLDPVGSSILLGGSLATILAHQYDAKVRDRYREEMPQGLATFGAVWGSGGPGLLIGATQLYVDQENGIAHLEGLAFTALSHVSLVAIAQRPRPHKKNNRSSFPSGHSSSAMATATSLSYAYGWGIAIPAYTAALVTMASRISDDRHWLSDTVAGATIGLFWGRATSMHPQIKLWQLQPFWSARGAGIEVQRDF